MSIIEPTEVKKISIGDEFIEWAEKYWRLDVIIKMIIEEPYKSNPNGEVGHYDYMREIFIKKINELIKQKLGL